MDIPRQVRPKRRSILYLGLGIVCIGVLTLGIRGLANQPPSVDRATLWIDRVRSGPLLREVQGQGTLVPLEIRYVTALNAGRIEKVHLRPGARVTSETVLLEMTNPDLELSALEADRQVVAAQAELQNLRAQLEGQRLAQESQIASLASETGDATRRARADQDLYQRGFLSELERGQSNDRAEERKGRLQFEERRLQVMIRGTAAQASAQQSQVARLLSIAEFRKRQVQGLHLRAEVDGVLQELPVQPGQWVTPGTILGKVARPEHLKAEIRVPENLAKDIVLGQRARVNTHNGMIQGSVARIDPAVQGGAVRVDIALVPPLPEGCRPDLSIFATIELEHLARVLQMGRPVLGQMGDTVLLFRVRGRDAVRVPVKLGRSSLKDVEMVSGLQEGDEVILSDMAAWDGVDRLRLVAK